MLKEEFKNAIYDSEKNTFDFLYFVSTRRKHDSGYYIIEVYGKDEGKFYELTRCSDVLDLSGIHFETDIYWNLVSIDVPEPSVFRMFIHQSGFKFCTPLKGCSSFPIKVVKEQQKQIKDLKDENSFLKDVLREKQKEYISKDKIRAKIKELVKNEYWNYSKIRVLKELLEENYDGDHIPRID